MSSLTCPGCGSEVKTAAIRRPVGDGITLRRKRPYCPECGPPENATLN